jgi:hypothetical protein
MPRLRFVQSLTDAIRQSLEDRYRHHASFALRQRAHAILLNARGFTIPQLQEIFAVDRDTTGSRASNSLASTVCLMRRDPAVHPSIPMMRSASYRP